MVIQVWKDMNPKAFLSFIIPEALRSWGVSTSIPYLTSMQLFLMSFCEFLYLKLLKTLTNWPLNVSLISSIQLCPLQWGPLCAHTCWAAARGERGQTKQWHCGRSHTSAWPSRYDLYILYSPLSWLEWSNIIYLLFCFFVGIEHRALMEAAFVYGTKYQFVQTTGTLVLKHMG